MQIANKYFRIYLINLAKFDSYKILFDTNVLKERERERKNGINLSNLYQNQLAIKKHHY